MVEPRKIICPEPYLEVLYAQLNPWPSSCVCLLCFGL